MNSKIRNLILAPAVALAFALASHSAKADATARVPFSFTVAGHACPAGDYIIRRNALNNTVSLLGPKVGFTWNLKIGDGDPTAKHVALQFREQGENHSLSLIQYGSETTYRLDKKNSNQRERESIRSIAGQ
jgi:hypothetical protein